MTTKYVLDRNDTVTTPSGVTLYRIKAVRAFGSVQAGDLGGYVESENNLSHASTAWVYNGAWVSGTARVFGYAEVFGTAWVYDDAEVFGRARVYDDAGVFGYAEVSGTATPISADTPFKPVKGGIGRALKRFNDLAKES